MTTPEEHKTVIGIKTAMLLFAGLAAFAFLTLKGPALVIALLIVFALAVKAFVHHLRRRISG
jgi:fatty acid desaturase